MNFCFTLTLLVVAAAAVRAQWSSSNNFRPGSNSNGWNSNSNSNNDWNRPSNNNNDWNRPSSNNNRPASNNNGWNSNSNNNNDWNRPGSNNNNRPGSNNNDWRSDNNNNNGDGMDWNRGNQWSKNKNNGRKAAYHAFKNKIFHDRGQDTSVSCGTGQENWIYKTWTIGGTRDYYVNRGQRFNMNACVLECDREPSCYAVLWSGSRNCYLLFADSAKGACKYLVSGHYGATRETCSSSKPCQAAYRVCKQPRCTVESIMGVYCNSNRDEDRALDECTAQKF